MGQRLAKQEIDSRVVIKLDKSIKKTSDGINGLMIYGQENDYPQVIERLINGSVTAKAAANIYSKFLTGLGFENEAINNIKIGVDSRGKKITVRSLLSQVAQSCANNNGFYLHCNQTAEKLVSGVFMHPFKNCRFAKPDDVGYSAKVLVYDNWDKDKESGKKYDKTDIREYNVFNLDTQAFSAQVSKEINEGKKWKGQVYFMFLDNQYFYPLSPFDSAYLDCDSEAQIGLFKNRQLRDSFLNKVIISTNLTGTEDEKDQQVEDIKSMMGPDGDSVLIMDTPINAENGQLDDQSQIKVENINTNVDAKLYDSIEQGITNNIRKAVGGIPAILIDYEESKLGGTSGEAIIQATNYYNALTSDARNEISKAFEEVLSNFDNEELMNNNNWNIKPLSLIEVKQEEALDQAELKKIESQSTLKGSVGGVTALLSLQQAVSAGTADLDAAINIVKEIYGFDEDTARRMIGTPKINENDIDNA